MNKIDVETPNLGVSKKEEKMKGYVQVYTGDGKGNIYVTGYSNGFGSDYNYKFVTVKYTEGLSCVSVIDNAFVPGTDTISLGDSVRWSNGGAVPHTSTSDTKNMWDSGTLFPGESFTFK